jgi:hypothetical protein
MSFSAKLRLSLATVLGTGLSLSGCADHPPLKAQVDWVGTYTAEQSVRVNDPSSITGKRSRSSSVKLEKPTTQIVAALDTYFGVGYTIVGPVSREPVPVRVVWHYPPAGLASPISGKTVTSTFDQVCRVNVPCNSGKRFTEQWELVPGKWVMEIWAPEQMLVRQEFEVSVP